MALEHITADKEIRLQTVLRRYMDLPKLLDLFHFKMLYFRRADGFADRLEGALFPSLRRVLNEEFENKRIPFAADDFYNRARLGNYVSCWTIGARDNMALWQLYGGVKTSVVVTTTVDRLVTCAAGWDRPIHLHKVKYVDHRRVKNYVIGSSREVLQYKSDAYRYEKELRIVVPQQGEGWKSNAIGMRLSLPSVDALVRSIVVSPEADDDFFDVIRALCQRYEVAAPVRRSALSIIPI
jgi:hypothetical protein